jgi:hypothetical protein
MRQFQVLSRQEYQKFLEGQQPAGRKELLLAGNRVVFKIVLRMVEKRLVQCTGQGI